MNTICPWVPLLFCWTASALAAPPLEPLAQNQPEIQVEGPPAILVVGEQRLLKLPHLEKFTLGGKAIRALSPAILGTSPDSALLLKAQEPGLSDLWIFYRQDVKRVEHRSIRVLKSSDAEIPLTLERALGRLSETQVLYSGGGVILRGAVHSLDELSRIRALSEGFPKSVRNETTPTEALFNQARKALQDFISKTPDSAQLLIQGYGNDLWIRGSLDSPQKLAALERQLRALWPPLQWDVGTLPDHSPTVHFRVFLLEIKSSQLSRIGISWPTQIPAFSPKEGVPHLDHTLEMLEGEGSARVLSKPELVVRAPGEAELFSGGEIPISLQSRFSWAVNWKPHGLLLKLKVLQSTTVQVRLEIQTEVSQLDPTQSSQGEQKIPGLKANRMKTQVDAQYGKPLLLSGLLHEEKWKKAEGIPWFHRLPLIGALFGVEETLEQRSELVAILIPNLTPPQAPLDKIFPQKTTDFPKGPVPMARNWISPEQEKRLRSSSDFPWNAFSGNAVQ